MKRIIVILLAFAGCTLAAMAQKFALVDMEYIMSNIPAYERANEQLNQASKKWQAEVEAVDNQAKALYKNYQNEAMFLSENEKASELKKKYFAPQGELYKKRQSLIEPIQDEIYNAVKSIAQSRGYQLILDRASESAGIIFASPSIDISNEVLSKLGYSN
jgi:outer membrane protein